MRYPKKITLFSVVSILFLLFLLILIGDNGLLDMNKLKEQKTDLSRKNEQLARENISLYREINRMKNDPEYLESVARQELGVIAEDEIILKSPSRPAKAPKVRKKAGE